MTKKPKRTAAQLARLRQFEKMQRAFKRVQIRVNQVTINKAVKKDRGNIRAILKGHSDTNAIKKELNHYFRTTSPQIWRSALKQVWLDAGAASIELHHAFFTGAAAKSYLDELDDDEPEDEWAPLPQFNFFVKAADPTDSWVNSVDDYLRGNGAGRADGISSTTGDQVMNAIADGVANKEGTADIAARVEDQLDTTWPGRAETIARTETAAATNQASLEDAQSTVPGMTKVWLCSFVNSREWHEDADQQTVALDEPFDVMEEDLDYPGDPSGSPENVINCMCSIGYDTPSGEAPAEGEAPELSDEQTSQLADLYDQMASGEGPLSSEEAQAMAGGVEDIVGPAEGAAPAEEGIQIEGLSGDFAKDTEQSILALRDDPLFKELDVEPKILAEEADTERKMYFAKGLDYENLYANPKFDMDNYHLSYDIGHSMIQEGTTPDLMSYYANDLTESMKWNMEHEYYHLWNNEQLATTGGGGTSNIFSDERLLMRLGSNLSTYSAANDQEAAAESFVAWRNGYADKLPEEVVEFFRLKFGVAYEGVLV